MEESGVVPGLPGLGWQKRLGGPQRSRLGAERARLRAYLCSPYSNGEPQQDIEQESGRLHLWFRKVILIRGLGAKGGDRGTLGATEGIQKGEEGLEFSGGDQ